MCTDSYFLRKLRSFNICSKMLEIFYQSVVASAIFFAAVCRGSSIRASDFNRLDKIFKKAGFAPGLSLESFETVVERRTLNKLLSIVDNDQRPLHPTVNRQQSTFSHRLLEGTDTGNLSCHMPSHCTITAKTLKNTAYFCHLDRERNKRQPTSKEELWDVLQEAWRTIPEDY